MVALTDRAAEKVLATMTRAEVVALVGKTASVFQNGALIGVYDGSSAGTRGQIIPYDDSDVGCRFLGVHVGDQHTAAAGDEVSVQIDGVTLDRCTVAGSGSSAAGTPVYALSDNPDDMTITKTNAGQDIIGNLLTQVNGAEWAVLLRPGVVALDAALNPPRVCKVTAYTGNGVIALPTSDGEAARLTSASTAVMTLAVPTNAILGYRFTIYRALSTGTNNVTFTGEAGGLGVTHVLAEGGALTLLAVSTTGWRPV